MTVEIIMQIPETPSSVEQLDLMKRLAEYAEGRATWKADGSAVGQREKQACQALHTNLVQLVNKVIAPLLDRVTAREMDMFTMHDRTHGLKVAHLMWHILSQQAQNHLTPPEIGIMVAAAHFHDLGMALTNEERAQRLDPSSDLWDRLEIQEPLRDAIHKLRTQCTNPDTPESERIRALHRLAQAEEALLCQDTRDRHATRQRYEEIRNLLAEFHQKDSVRIPDIETSLSFDGDSFYDKMIEVCVSHRGDASTLVQGDENNPGRPRLPRDYPVGCATADLHMAAAALRIADTLDFDRERTPAVLFHYLLPGTLSLENKSKLEWNKHLAISNWNIERDDIVFRGRCNSHIIHHTVVQFCHVIAEEIAATRATFDSSWGESSWPFIVPSSVKPDIHEEGYRYVPYQFELDDERVYTLLMGGAIYDDPLVAVRELVQNAVDACKLRDALMRLYEPHVQPSTSDRIIVRFEEPTDSCAQPRLVVTDTGTGMDAWLIDRYFLKVGRSYYHSSDFNQFRVELRKRNLDFAPISEFGIGFLSVFLLADRVEVETAMWEPIRQDARKHKLVIDGPTRLIRLDEQPNEGPGRFKGTKITLYLCRGSSEDKASVPPTWEEIGLYLKGICQDLPYDLKLEHISDQQIATESISPRRLVVQLPSYLEKAARRIPVADRELELEGEIVLLDPEIAMRSMSAFSKRAPVIIQAEKKLRRLDTTYDEGLMPDSVLLRGGFNIGEVPGLPTNYIYTIRADIGCGTAVLRLTWESRVSRRYLMPNLARNAVADKDLVANNVARLWLTYLLEHVNDLSKGFLVNLACTDIDLEKCVWLQQYDAFRLYELARQMWLLASLEDHTISKTALTAWESGTGKSLKFNWGSGALHYRILHLIMPRIADLQIHPREFYLKPPLLGWRDILKKWQNYVTNPVRWDRFAEYVSKIENLLFFDKIFYLGPKQFFNLRFKDRLDSYTEKELDSLRDILSRLATARYQKMPTGLTEDETMLLRRVKETVGDFEIGCADYDGKRLRSWPISQFNI
jgi:hypothetical protein